MDINQFVSLYPRLYHMAEVGAWPSIKKHGLLSTSAVLNLHGVAGKERHQYEKNYRPEKMTVGSGKSAIVLRDQKPMPPNRLYRALTDGSTPEQWYQLLNGKVFMWAEESRLLHLLSARQYKNLEHDVLTIDTASLVAKHLCRISLCRMNSGNTYPFFNPRKVEDFKPIGQYPTNKSGLPEKPVVEVVVDNAVPDIVQHVVEVRRMKAQQILAHLPL